MNQTLTYNERYHYYKGELDKLYQEKLAKSAEHLKEFLNLKLDDRQLAALKRNQTIINNLKQN